MVIYYWDNFNLGFRISAANTLDMINDDLLRRELYAKNVICEVPNCYEVAVNVMREGVCGWVCEVHFEISLGEDKAAAALIRAVKNEKQAFVEKIKNNHFKSRLGPINDGEVFTKVLGQSVLKQAEQSFVGIDKLKDELYIMPPIF